MNSYIKIGIFFILIGRSFLVFSGEKYITAEKSSKQITVTGFTRARSTILLSSEFSGKVKNIFADIGDAIPENSYFSCLDDAFVKIDIKSEKNYINKEYGNIDFYSKQVKRHKKLVEKNTAAISLLDDLMRQLDNARKEMQKHALLKQRLEEQQKRFCIEAPVGWIVTDKYIEVGQWVNVGTLIGKAGDYSSLLIPLALLPSELIELKKQNDIEIYLPEYQQHVSASIEHISPAFDEQSHKILVDLLIKNNLPDNRGGIRAELTFKVDDNGEGVFIPRQAIEERYEEYWVERKDGKRLAVKLMSEESNNRVKIFSPEIKPGDQFKLQY